MKTPQLIINSILTLCTLGFHNNLTSQSIETEGTIEILMNSTTGTPHIRVEEDDVSSGGSTRIEMRNASNATERFEIRSFLHPSVDPTLGWYFGNSPLIFWNAQAEGLGVGSVAIQEKLNVGGAIKIGNTTGSNAGTIRYNGADLQGYVGGSWQSLTSGGGGSSPWTDNGSEIYFDVPGNQVGIGTPSPSSDLHIIANNTAGETVDFTNDGVMIANADLLNLTMANGSSDDAQFIECRRFTNLMFRVNGDGSVWAGEDRFRVVGNTGDVYITDSSAGVILTSPNGNCWRMTINNSGVPSYTNVTCP